MPPFLAELVAQLKGIWSRLDGGQRLTIAAVLAATIVGLGGIVWYAGRPDYEVVHTATDAAELDESAQALGKAGVAFKTDGNRILVDRDLRDAARLALARAGVESRGESEDFGALSNLTLDSNGRREVIDGLKRRRAETAVRKMVGVADAYVTADRPKRSPYAALDSAKPSATVTITLGRDQSFHAIARAAIAQVASAIGIAEEDVTAINARTKERFSLTETRGGMADVGDFLAQQRERGEELRLRAQQILDRLYPDKALVTVTVDLDPAWERRVEQIQPETPAVLSDDTTKNRTQDGDAAPGGDPSSTAATTGQTGGGGGAAATTQESRKREYQPFSGTRDSGLLAPDVRRLTVALVLDESIDQAKHTQIGEAVKSAVGFSEQRSSGLADKFEILTEKFPELPEAPAVAGPAVVELLERHGPLAGQIVAVLLVLWFLRTLLRRSSRVATPAAAAGEGDGGEPEPAPEEQLRQLRREIEKSIAEDPAAISRLLEGWLAEQKA